jgi:hypothetical protein
MDTGKNLYASKLSIWVIYNYSKPIYVGMHEEVVKPLKSKINALIKWVQPCFI